MLWGPPPTSKLAHATAPPVAVSMQPPVSSPAVAAVEEIFTDDHWDGDGTRNREHIPIDGQCEAGTLTDLHNTSNIPEVELFSLLEEKIPMYKLRADTTSNYSYEHSDWLWSADERARQQQEQPCELLSPVMMEETLKYFMPRKVKKQKFP